MILYTTLNELQKYSMHEYEYDKLLYHIGVNYPADKQINLLTILDCNGFGFALWALGFALPKTDRKRISRLFACDCAESVLNLFEAKNPYDFRPRNAIEVARRYALGEATEDELQRAGMEANEAFKYLMGFPSDMEAAAAASAAYAAAISADFRASHDALYAVYKSGIYANWAEKDAAQKAEQEKQKEILEAYLQTNPTAI